jgi:streptogramin lyase
MNVDISKCSMWRVILAILLILSACETDDPGDAASKPGNIYTVAGVAGSFDYSGDGGLATDATLGFISGIHVTPSGDIYFADGAANVVRKISQPSGIISTIAGTFLGFNATDPNPAQGDGGPATDAHLNIPFGVTVDASGNLYITDTGNNTIRGVMVATGNIVTVAGSPNNLGFSGFGEAADSAILATPYDITVGPSGDIYFVDSQNNVACRISHSTGILSIVAGAGPLNSGYLGDNGPAVSAKLNAPQGIAVDADGDVFIADAGNHVIRKVDHDTGIITTVAGLGTFGYTGDSGPATAATLYAPSDVAVDINGNVYIADQGNHVIRKVDKSTGIIHTLGGTGSAGYSGDGGPAGEAKLSSPQSVAVDESGNLFFTDRGNSIIRVIIQ